MSETVIRTAGMLAESRAGHDIGKLYVVLEADDVYCSLVNGKTRPIEKPKKKKRMHLQLITHLPDETAKQMDEIRNDADIRRILQLYKDRR